MKPNLFLLGILAFVWLTAWGLAVALLVHLLAPSGTKPWRFAIVGGSYPIAALIFNAMRRRLERRRG